jgi:parallel beta-helix repeat protein
VSNADEIIQILYVGGNGAGNYSSIQTAIENATTNSHIYIYNGTYNETINIKIPLFLEGENPITTKINGQEKNSVIRISADFVTINNLTIQLGLNTFPEASIAIHSNHNTITNNHLKNSFYGIVLLSASYNYISNNHISNNNQCGIYFSDAKFNQLTNNIVDTQPFNGFGIYDFSDNNYIANNTFLNNQLYGINIRDSYNNQIIGNKMINNSYGLHIPQPQFQTIMGANHFLNNDHAIIEEQDYMFIVLPETLLLLIICLFIFRKFLFKY